MPEGPEVKLSAELIRPLVVGKSIINAHPNKKGRYNKEDPEGFCEFLKTIGNLDCKVLEVKNKGKFTYWSFENGWYMFCTFGMTGQWSPNEGKHPCFDFYFDANQDPASIAFAIYFNDPRHFGTIKFTQDTTELAKKLDELGWDPLSMQMVENLPWIKWQLSKTSKPIGEVLMDQGVFAGVGNYIRAEALYSCKLSPFRGSKSLTEDEIRNLCQAIVNVMEESYKHQGATIQTYKTVYGEEGKYSTLFKIYGKKTDPLGNKIIKQDSGGRTIHWCPTIQI